MQIISHFSCYENLPIRLQDVADHVTQETDVDVLLRAAVDVSPKILHGTYRQYRIMPPYSDRGGHMVGEVLYSKHLGPFDARLTQCKEMLHAFDTAGERAAEVEEVERLARDIIIPFDLLIKMNGEPSSHVISDQAKIYPAIAVLLPGAFLDAVRPSYEAGHVSVSQIAKYAQVPSAYVRFALRPEWGEIVSHF
jgi:hypothetical protein